MKILHINYIDHVEHCGTCLYDQEDRCQLTGTTIEDHWDGVQDDCPLEDIGEVIEK